MWVIYQELMSDAVLCYKTVVHEIKILKVGRSVGHTKLGAVENGEKSVCCVCSQNWNPSCCQGECYKLWSVQLRLHDGSGSISVLWRGIVDNR